MHPPEPWGGGQAVMHMGLYAFDDVQLQDEYVV